MEDHKKFEDDYPHHQQNPGPSKQAFEETNDRPAGNMVKWVIILAIIILATIIFLYNY